jgi:hypothetical protein
MPDVHVPDFGGHHGGGKSLFKLGLEVLLIAVGVFLGLAGEQWRERAQHRELAEQSLRRFLSEIEINRKSVAAVKDYHATTQNHLIAYFRADAKEREATAVEIRGLQPAFFEHTAWDLALATQSLAYIDSDLAFAISRVYSVQQEYDGLSRGILQAMYVRTPRENMDGFLSAVNIYYGDVVGLEPKLIERYDAITPRLSAAIAK